MDKEGKPITGLQGERKRWVEHFEELLNRPTPLNPPDIEVAPTDLSVDFTTQRIEEIRMTIRKIKSRKAVGQNYAPAEVLESNMEVTANILHVLFGKVWEEEQVQTDLIKVPKK
ncbi:unnamed protein product [Schistosoma curassoni]|uniref:Uncharacterized protein n=1 Tax=Schistosoma curassoni TaxID=6186 RepID=A0A183JNQ0_9TREM|nr:unnamed protein product [Schistosoma curassoni]